MQFFGDLSGKDYGQKGGTGCSNQVAVQIHGQPPALANLTTENKAGG